MKLLEFPADRWRPTKPLALRVSEAYRPVRRGSGVACMADGCTRMARRQVISTGIYLCGRHHAWRQDIDR